MGMELPLVDSPRPVAMLASPFRVTEPFGFQRDPDKREVREYAVPRRDGAEHTAVFGKAKISYFLPRFP